MNYISNLLKHLSQHSSVYLASGVILLLGIVLWLPFGFRNTGLVEEWTFMENDQFNSGQVWVLLPYNRIATGLPYVVGYLLTPDSFVGMIFILFLIMLGQGVIYYLFFHHVTGNSSFALITALLGVIYPAGTGIFYTRLLNYQLLPLCYFLAAYLLLLYWEHPNKVKLLMMWSISVILIWISELAIPTILLTPLFLYYQEKQISNRLLKVTALWYVPLAGSVLIWLYLYQLGKFGYLSNLASTNSALSFQENIQDILNNVVRAYRRAYFEGWKESLQDLNLLFVVLAVGFSITVFLVTLLQLRRQQMAPNRSVYFLLLITGLGLFFTSFAPLLFSVFHRGLNDRFFMLASPWAALSVAAVIYLVSTSFSSNIRPFVFPSLSAPLIALAVLYALQQHQNTVGFSAVEREIISTIVTTIPEPEGKVIVLYDDSGWLGTNEYFWGLGSTYGHFNDALSFVYEKPVSAFTCVGPYRCQFDDKYFYYYYTPKNQLAAQVPLQEIVAFRYCYSTSLLEQIPNQLIVESVGANYDPQPLVDDNQPPPKRLNDVYHDWFIDVDINYFDPIESRRFEFDSHPPGCGWSGVEPIGIWSTSTDSTLFYELDEEDYRISFRILYFLQSENLATLKLYVNDTFIPLTQTPDATGAPIFEGIIPKEAIAEDQEASELRFVIDHVASPQSLGLNPDIRTLGLFFDWIQITSTEQ